MSECQMEGCGYEAEYDGWCKWCMHHLDRSRVEADYPDLAVLP